MKMFGTICLSAFFPFVFMQKSHAAPKDYKATCTVIKSDGAPGLKVNLKKGQTAEIYQEGDIRYEVFYGDFLEQKNLVQLRILNTATNKQALSQIYVKNEFPPAIVHVSEIGGLFCLNVN